MKIARVKMLSNEEERVAEVEEAALLKTEPDKARLAPALSDLAATIAHFSAFVANIPREDLSSSLLTPYKFSDMARQATVIQEQEMNKSLDRWKDALDNIRNMAGTFDGLFGFRSLNACDP